MFGFAVVQVNSVTKTEDGRLNVHTNNSTIQDVDCLLWAIGRLPNVDIGLDKIVSTRHEDI